MTTPPELLKIVVRPQDHGLGPWSVTVLLADVEGRLECVGIELESNKGQEVLTSTKYRSLPLAKVVTAAKVKAASSPSSAGELKALKKKAKDELEKRDHSLGGPKGFPPKHFAEVAAAYAKAWREGRPPVQAVAEKWSTSPSAAAKWVYRARQLGLLAPTTKGKPSGQIISGGEVSMSGSGRITAKATVKKAKSSKRKGAAR